jgi:acetyl-CoA C-acetyltransferase
MTRNVAIIGGAASPVGKLQSPEDADVQVVEHEILGPLVIKAMAESGIPKEKIEALILTLCRPYTLQKYFATFMANYLRLPLSGTIMELLGNGMTGGLAFDQAVNTVALGQADVALALGVNTESS